MIMKYKITVNGHGYELLGKNVDYRLQSSVKKDSPENIEGSIHREIHIHSLRIHLNFLAPALRATPHALWLAGSLVALS